MIHEDENNGNLQEKEEERKLQEDEANKVEED